MSRGRTNLSVLMVPLCVSVWECVYVLVFVCYCFAVGSVGYNIRQTYLDGYSGPIINLR